MTDLYRKLHEYAKSMTSAAPDYLYELERETHLTTLAPQMLSGPLQGRFLALISQLVRPKLALEIGTFTGYAALCLAEGLADDGVLHTLEANPELEPTIKRYFDKAGIKEEIQLHIGDAKTLIPEIPGVFDLIFLDAGKQDYPFYYNLLIDRIRPGGILIADNVLWSGKVLNPETDADAQVLHQFNQQVQQDERVENVLLPLRDGLLIVRKL